MGKVPVCIIGMHRSGTSMVARLLNLCGLNLGPEDKLFGPSPDNAMGYFEHAGFLEINDALLKNFGGSWDNPPSLNPGWETDPALRDSDEKAETLLNTFSGDTLWGWKDPRTTLLLPFWQKLLPQLRYIICIRNPLEVARSLEKRDGISIAVGAELWNQYMRSAIMHTEGQSRIVTFYEDYFSNPLDEVNRVAEFCGLETVGDLSKVQEVILGELRHQCGGAVELLSEASIPLEYKLLYLGLRALASGVSGPQMTERGVVEKVALGSGILLTLMDQFHKGERVAQLEGMLAEKERQLSNLQTRMDNELRAKNEQMARLSDHNARLQAFSNAVRQTWAYRVYETFLKPFRV